MRSAFSYKSGSVALLSLALFAAAPAAQAQQAAAPAKSAPAQQAPQAKPAQPASPQQPPTTAQVVAAARAAPAIVGDKQAASKVDFSKWGLAPSDFSVLDDVALRKKAGSATPLEKLAEAADAGDVVAMYLAGVRFTESGDPKKGMEYIQRAAEHGVVRAISEVSAAQLIGAAGDTERASGGFEGMRLCARTGSAASGYILGRVMLTTQVGQTWSEKNPAWAQEASTALLYSAQAGYAPSIVTVVKLAILKLEQEGENPALRKFAETNLDKAVALGNAEAIALKKQLAAAKKK